MEGREKLFPLHTKGHLVGAHTTQSTQVLLPSASSQNRVPEAAIEMNEETDRPRIEMPSDRKPS